MIPPRKTVFFAATHRSGSTFLMDHIAKIDRLGRPGELFYPQNFVPLLRDNGLDPDSGADAWIPLVIEKGKSPNGVFSSKIFGDNVRWLADTLAKDQWPESLDAVAALFETYFPNPYFISIRRRDKFRQGISLYKAIHSGLWHSTQSGNVRPKKVLYHHKEIQYAVDCILFEEANLDRLFRTLDVAPLDLYYEEIVSSPDAAAKRIFDFCGEPFPSESAMPKVQHRKLGNAETDRWLERFQRELHDIRHRPQMVLLTEGQSKADRPAILDLTAVLESVPPGKITKPIQIKALIRNLYHERIGFLGDSQGIGDISLFLKTVDAASGEEVARAALPCPRSLAPGQSESVLHEYIPPQDPGRYDIAVIAEQRCPDPRELARSDWLTLSVGKSPDRVVQDAFGCGAKGPDDWFLSPWFGHLYAGDYPWVYSRDHGWVRVFVAGQEEGGVPEGEIQFWDSELGNWSTNQNDYPRIRAVRGGQMELVSADESTRRFLALSGEEKVFGRGIKGHENNA